MGFGTNFLKFIHTLVFIIGVVILGVSIAILVEGSNYFPGDENHGASSWYGWG